MRQQRAPVALFQPQPPQISARHLHLSQQLPRGKWNRLPVAHFLQHNGIAARSRLAKICSRKVIDFAKLSILRLADS